MEDYTLTYRGGSPPLFCAAKVQCNLPCFKLNAQGLLQDLKTVQNVLDHICL